jgi:hypothetical protein
MQTSRKAVAIAIAALAACAALAATAYAVLATSGGGAQVRMMNISETASFSTSSIAWVPVPGATVGIGVPTAGQLVNARFTAESVCTGPNAGMCRVRIVALTPAAVIELNPASGNTFAFDSDVPGASIDTAEGHAIERSRRLPAGTYQIQVQYSVTNATSIFTLADWHFAVELSV